MSRECFELLSVECFDASKGLFKRFKDNPQALVSPTLHKKTFEFSDTLSSIHACTYTHAHNVKYFLFSSPVPYLLLILLSASGTSQPPEITTVEDETF